MSNDNNNNNNNDEDLWARIREAEDYKRVANAQKEFEAVAKNIANGNGKGKADEKFLPTFPTYKYSKLDLHEAIIVNGLPFFLKYDFAFSRLVTTGKIQENSRVLRPPNREEYPYTPYKFILQKRLMNTLIDLKMKR